MVSLNVILVLKNGNKKKFQDIYCIETCLNEDGWQLLIWSNSGCGNRFLTKDILRMEVFV